MFFRTGSAIYIFKKGLHNLKKNAVFTIASIITMIICILMFGIFYAAMLNMRGFAKSMQSSVTISVFMEPDIGEKRIKEIGEEIKKHPSVTSAEYITGDEVWKEYKSVYFRGKEDLAEGFDEDNPLADSGHYDVHMNDVSKQTELADAIAGLSGVRQINQSQQVADVFTDVNKALIIFSAAIVVILIVVSIFLIQNTISAGIAMRQKEISVMKSIGATEFFIQTPFVIEAFVIGAAGTAVPLVSFHFLYGKVMQYVESKFQSLGGLLTFIEEERVLDMLTPVAVGMGIGISILGSILVLHKKIAKIS